MRLETAVPMLPSSRGRMRWTNGKAARKALTARWIPEGPSSRAFALELAKARPERGAAKTRCDPPGPEGRVAGFLEPTGSGEPTARGCTCSIASPRRDSSIGPFPP